MRVQWMGLTTLPADSLPTLDWNAAVILAGTFVGTAVAVFFGYRAKRAEPAAPSKDVILPSATIADMRWGPELLAEVKGLSLCISDWRDELRNWRADEINRRHAKEVSDAYEKGRRDREARGGRRQED